MHKLLERQLKRQFGSLEAVPPSWGPLLETVSITYEQGDSDRRLVEHSLDLASQELLQHNAKLAEAYDRLHRVDQERLQFLNNAAHELATPLTPIKLQMRLLRLAGDAPESQAKATMILERNFDRLAQLVKDLLDAARLQATSLKLHLRDVDLREVVAQSVETYMPAAREAGVLLRVDGDLPETVACVDSSRIGQVLDNLLSNALKFTPRDGSIDVELHLTPGQMATVRVCDTGSGMRPQDLELLFKPFSQVHDTMQRTLGGTGLGLYVSRGIIEAHGGTIHATSVGPGHGSTFWFDVPTGAKIVEALPPRPTEPVAVVRVPSPDPGKL